MSILKRLEHRLYLEWKRFRLKNKSFTLISDNCNGGMILHDLRLRFNTPTINLYFLPEDYLRFLENLEYYLTLELTEVQDASVNYPVGRIGDVRVYFMHYESFEQAKEKWLERVQRVDREHLYILMTDKNHCTYQQLQRFDRLAYPRKCVFTYKPYKELKSACYMPGFEDAGEVGVLSDFRPSFWKRRYLDSFDYVSFLNQR